MSRALQVRRAYPAVVALVAVAAIIGLVFGHVADADRLLVSDQVSATGQASIVDADGHPENEFCTALCVSAESAVLVDAQVIVTVGTVEVGGTSLLLAPVAPTQPALAAPSPGALGILRV
jgi:hypothetical protein